jgi:hypothetical protein
MAMITDQPSNPGRYFAQSAEQNPTLRNAAAQRLGAVGASRAAPGELVLDSKGALAILT